MKNIVIVDYQSGNIFSIINAFNKISVHPKLSFNPQEIMDADAIVLPGVGAFENAINALDEKKLTGIIRQFAASKKPIMGVCLGMQLLFDTSYEFGEHQGLGLIPGHVKRIPSHIQDQRLKIPHVGWNRILSRDDKQWDSSPYTSIKKRSYVYFIHSYYVEPKSTDCILSTTNYCGFEYCSSIKSDNIFATQFHPEKSGEVGISILKSWVEQLG